MAMDPGQDGFAAMEEDLDGPLTQEDQWVVIESYFQQHNLVSQQINSFNNFINNRLQVRRCAHAFLPYLILLVYVPACAPPLLRTSRAMARSMATSRVYLMTSLQLLCTSVRVEYLNHQLMGWPSPPCGQNMKQTGSWCMCHKGLPLHNKGLDV